MTTTLHAHIETYSRDCDGAYSGAHSMFFNEDEALESLKEFNDFSEIHFMERVMASVASPYAIQHATVSIREDGIEVHESTEEGYRDAEVNWCRDDCTDTKVYFRDHAAEAAGY